MRARGVSRSVSAFSLTESRAALERGLVLHSPLLHGLDDAATDALLAAASRRVLQPGAVVFRQGAAPAHLHLLVAGRAKVWQTSGGGTPLAIRFMQPGDLLGCVAVFRQIPYPATATCTEESALLTWPASRLAELMQLHSRLALNALGIVGGRTEELLQRLRELATERVDRRVARTLLRLAEQAGRPTADGLEIGFPISRQDIAELTGTDHYNVSRILRRWEREGILGVGRRRVVLRNAARLAGIAEAGD